jgi:CDP-glucose 4,6-dehydratase
MSAVGINDGFWRDRRVFLTGHTGFVGGWLSLALARLGARVTGYALTPPTEPNLFAAVRLAKTVDSTIADVRDGAALAKAVAAAKPEIVFHLAAQPLVRDAFADPVGTYATNVMGTVHLLEAARAVPNVAAVVVMTTDKVYLNKEWPWGYRENDRLGGREPYGTSKAAAELVVDAYRESYLGAGPRPVGVATVRAGNVVGGGDWARDRLVPDAMRAFAGSAPLLLRNPLAVRPWQHVLEPVRGLMTLAERLVDDPVRYAGPWNFGPAEGDMWPVERVVAHLIRQWGRGARCEMARGAQPYEARLLSVNSAKASTELGWEPVWRVGEALDRAVEWYRAFHDGADVRTLTLDHIERFAGAAGAPVRPLPTRRAGRVGSHTGGD